MDEPYIYHFPDGNASLARLMVRSLIPSVAPGDSMEDIVTARFDYGKLDEEGSRTRLRLSSTAVSVRNHDGGVDIGYVQGGDVHRIRAERCVLAGYHMMIPEIMPELPAPQRKALWKNVKAPLVYVNVAVRDWHPWVRLGVHEITNPMGFFSRVKIDYPVSLGTYRFPSSPDEPMLLHLVHVPTVPFRELTAREEFRAGREILYELTFEEFEEKVRDELTRMLGPGGFDADRDIAAITVNRWGHAYSYMGDPLSDPVVVGEQPYEIARACVGWVAIANADAGWTPFAHAAIDQAHRAVGELLDDR
jgi:spermidine dehydrogenase